MTTRFVKGMARTETPRLKDNTVEYTARDPSEGRVEGGRFGVGNTVATGRGFKSQIKRLMGTNADDADVKAVLSLYLALIRHLPSAGPSVRTMCAAQARHTFLGAQFANLARAADIGSPDGLKLADAARSHDLAAQRLAVTALDISTKEAGARPPAPTWADEARARIAASTGGGK